MDNLKKITAKNIITLRTANHMTQFELGEKINYSDKAVSRWERADAVPDAYVLLKISKLFGVSVDYLLTSHDDEVPVPAEQSQPQESNASRYDYATITTISFICVLTLALLIFIIFTLFNRIEWMVFLYTLPVSIIVLLVFNSIWGKPIINLYIISALMWSILATVYISFLIFLKYDWWLLFLLGLPAQLIILLCFRVKRSEKRK